CCVLHIARIADGKAGRRTQQTKPDCSGNVLLEHHDRAVQSRKQLLVLVFRSGRRRRWRSDARPVRVFVDCRLLPERTAREEVELFLGGNFHWRGHGAHRGRGRESGSQQSAAGQSSTNWNDRTVAADVYRGGTAWGSHRTTALYDSRADSQKSVAAGRWT